MAESDVNQESLTSNRKSDKAVGSNRQELSKSSGKSSAERSLFQKIADEGRNSIIASRFQSGEHFIKSKA